MKNISDQQWLELLLDPQESSKPLGLDIPRLAPDEVQKAFTGSTGRPNLEQAMAFFQYVKSQHPLKRDMRVMDFGAGWGRIALFPLKELNRGNLYTVDPSPTAIEWQKQLGLDCQVVLSDPLPPIPDIQGKRFDIIYSFSVFSHLSEPYFTSWMRYFSEILNPGGIIVFTTRGRRWLDHIERSEFKPEIFGDYSAIREALDGDQHLFFQDRPIENRPLSGEWYGESFVPRAYLTAHLPEFEVVDFKEDHPHIFQTIVTLRPR